MTETKHAGSDPIVSGELEDWTYQIDAAVWINRWDSSLKIPQVQAASVHSVTSGRDRNQTPEERRDSLNKTLNSMAQAIHKRRKRGK